MSVRRSVQCLFLSGLLTAGVVTGCGDSHGDLNQPTGQQVAASNVPADTEFPGQGELGIVSEYVVFRVDDDLYLTSEVEAERFLGLFPTATRVGDTRIVYPDGSEQLTTANGNFDASTSPYAAVAAKVPLLQRQTSLITFIPPVELGLGEFEGDIFVTSPEEAARIEVGIIPEDAVPDQPPVAGPMASAIRAQGEYVFSGQQNDYLAAQGSFQRATWLSERLDYIPRLGREVGSEIRFKFRFNAGLTWFTPRVNLADLPGEYSGGDIKTDIKWTRLDGDNIEWEVIITRLHASGGRFPSSERLAIWVSPNIYFFDLAHNLHLSLIEI